MYVSWCTQEYEGRHCDVTITPWKGEENMLSSFAKMLKNVNTDEFRVMTIVGFGLVVAGCWLIPAAGGRS